jgi:antitoxin component YwqK of YwqJK toxin-antitoxin module
MEITPSENGQTTIIPDLPSDAPVVGMQVKFAKHQTDLGRYEGQFQNGYMEGRGTLFYKNADRAGWKYKGEFLANNPGGTGDLIDDSNVVRYRGTMSGGKRHGEGVEFNKHGSKKFEGKFVNDHKDGFGSRYRDNGKDIMYQGFVVGEKREGKGKEYTSKNELLYDGEWKNDKRCGQGSEYYKNGTRKYTGAWAENKKCGEGIKYNFYGDMAYEGGFANENFEGVGKEYYKDGFIKYSGVWGNGMRDGKGDFWYEPKMENGEKVQKLMYKGGWKKDKKDGKGKCHLADGTLIYDGFYKHDLRDGKGTYYEENGCIAYEGWWQSDIMHGKGIQHDKFGHKKYDGDFVNGVCCGYGIEFDKFSGDTAYEGNWKDGKKWGMGTAYWGNGQMAYHGEYKDDLKDGKGIEFGWEGDTVFEGRWIKNQKKYKVTLYNFMESSKTNLKTIKETKAETKEDLQKQMNLLNIDIDVIDAIKKSKKKSGEEMDFLAQSTPFFMTESKGKSSNHSPDPNRLDLASPKSAKIRSPRPNGQSPPNGSCSNYYKEMVRE